MDEIANQPENSKPAKRPVPPQLVGKTFKKGQSGNPKGRPKGKSYTELAREELAKFIPPEFAAKFGRERMTWGEFFVKTSFRHAAKRVADLDTILNRVEGKPLQTMNINSAMKTPLALLNVKVDELPVETLEKIYDLLTPKGEESENPNDAD